MNCQFGSEARQVCVVRRRCLGLPKRPDSAQVVEGATPQLESPGGPARHGQFHGREPLTNLGISGARYDAVAAVMARNICLLQRRDIASSVRKKVEVAQ